MFIEKLQIRHVGAKFVPRVLTDYQKKKDVEISQELLIIADGN
jgi:hypothetical protein